MVASTLAGEAEKCFGIIAADQVVASVHFEKRGMKIATNLLLRTILFLFTLARIIQEIVYNPSNPSLGFLNDPAWEVLRQMKMT